MLRVFMSYAWADDNSEKDALGDVSRFRKFLEAELRKHFKNQVEVFQDKSGIENDILPDTLKAKIEAADYFVVFLSPHYISRQNTVSEYKLIRAVEAKKIEDWQRRSAEEGASGQAPPFPRIYVVYLTHVDDLSNPSPISFIVRDLQQRIYFDFRTIRGSDPEAVKQTTFKISNYIANSHRAAKAAANGPDVPPPMDQESVFLPTADEGRRAIFARIERLLSSDRHTLFRDHLIDRLLTSLADELEALDGKSYRQDIGIDRSFVTRATSIFQPAGKVFAVSIDNYSSFWTKESLRAQALEYTKHQSENTFRVFVFSSPRSLIEHRNVLQAHHEVYGTNAEQEQDQSKRRGRVLFTTRKEWDKYFTALGKQSAAQSGDNQALINWTRAHSSADFGILVYTPSMDPVYYEATLDSDNLQFAEIEPHHIHRQFMNDLMAPMDGDELLLGGVAKAYRWRPDFVSDDKLWYSIVSAAFSDEDIENEVRERDVVHIVLFSREFVADDVSSAEVFNRRMRRVAPYLLDIKEGKHWLVQTLWYGSTGDLTARHIEPRLKAKLRLDNPISSNWPHCLVMTFKSQRDLDAYYKNDKHSEARQILYSDFSPEIGALFEEILNTESEEAKRKLGEALEVLVSRYMVRLDFASRDPEGVLKDYVSFPFPLD